MTYNEAFEPARRLSISSPEAFKVLTHPLRCRILGLLGPRAMTIRELGEALSKEPNRLYYHIKLLAKEGLIVVVGQRNLGNLTEKSYRAAALDFDASPFFQGLPPDRTSIEASTAAVADLMANSIKEAAKDLGAARERSSKDGTKTATMTLRMAEAKISLPASESFTQRLLALAEEFETLDGGEEGTAYVLSLAFYPQAGSLPRKGEPS